MANLWFDGFEGLITAYKNTQWSGAVFQVSTSIPRSPGAQCLFNSSSGTQTQSVSIGSNVAHGFFGAAVMLTANPSSFSANCLFHIRDGSTTQIGWRVNADWSISVFRGATSGDTLIGTTAAGVLAAGTVAADYRMVELEIVFATDTSGSVKLRVAGVEVLNVSGVQTSNTANAYANQIAVQRPNTNTVTVRWDDLYVNDDTGSAPENTYFGEAFCCVNLTPSSDGTYDGSWTPSTGTNAAALVDDTGNDDTDYIASATANHKQSYNMANVGQTGTVIGIHHHWIARKDDVATREVAELLFMNSTDYVGTTRAMIGSYQLFRERHLLSPDTGLRFTVAELDALEAGVKVIT